MAAITSTDGPLALSRRRLGDAVAALADPQAVALGGVYRGTDSLYTALRAALNGSKTGRSGVVRSAPCRIEVLNLLVAIDVTVAGWIPDGKGGTPGRLHLLTAHR